MIIEKNRYQLNLLFDFEYILFVLCIDKIHKSLGQEICYFSDYVNFKYGKKSGKTSFKVTYSSSSCNLLLMIMYARPKHEFPDHIMC